ncbi:hypothetical protein AB0C40_15780 [Streptomyces brevispora]|uniref:hypothetical protein n=1 Tax=Streptomyces brevispora TaxID=887462 RepID=UPI0033CD4C76
MKPARPKRSRASFMSIVRHIARRPLLIVTLLSICVGMTVLPHVLSAPWDSLSFGFGYFAGVWSISLTVPRIQEDEDQETDD